jgi:hypothetical protein
MEIAKQHGGGDITRYIDLIIASRQTNQVRAANTDTVLRLKPPPRSSLRLLNPVGKASGPPSLVARKSASALFTGCVD